MAEYMHLANAQKRKILEGGRAFLNTLELRLFVADITVTDAVMPDLGDECDDTGYLAVAPIEDPFPTVATTSSNKGVTPVDAPTITFTHSPGTFTVYGVMFTDPADSDVTVMAQRMDVPFEVTAAGQVYVISGNFELTTEVL